MPDPKNQVRSQDRGREPHGLPHVAAATGQPPDRHRHLDGLSCVSSYRNCTGGGERKSAAPFYALGLIVFMAFDSFTAAES